LLVDNINVQLSFNAPHKKVDFLGEHTVMKGGGHITFVARKDTKWAYDTVLGQPVFVGNKDELDINETRRRNNANRDPWGGVWTEPLVEGATKARFGPAKGLYTCCEDEECGVWVIVKQGPVNEWHFARDWLNGTTKQHKPENRKLCVNSSNYTGESRFHNVTKRQVYRYLKSKGEYHGKKIIDLRLEESLRVSQSDGTVTTTIPDVFVKFEDETWFAIEVVYKHPPKEEKHKAYKMNMVILDLRDEPVTESDNQFAKWVRDGGVEELLQKETTPARRRERYYERERYWNAENKRKRRAENQAKLSECAAKFGYSLYISNQQLEVMKPEDIEQLFQEEQDRRDLIQAIQKAIDRNVKKFGSRLRSEEPFESVQDVNKAYKEHFAEVELRQKIQRKFRSLESEHGTSFGLNIEDFSSTDEVEQAFQVRADEKKQKTDAIARLGDKFPNLKTADIESRLNWSTFFEDLIRTVEDAVSPRQQLLNDALEFCGEDAYLHATLTEVLTSFEIEPYPLEKPLEAFRNEVLRAMSMSLATNYEDWSAHLIDADAPKPTFSSPSIWLSDWYSSSVQHAEFCSEKRAEAKQKALQMGAIEEDIIPLITEILPDFHEPSEERYTAMIDNLFTQFGPLRDTVIERLEREHNIKFRTVPRENLGKVEEVKDWFNRAVSYTSEWTELKNHYLENHVPEGIKWKIRRLRIRLNSITFSIKDFRIQLEDIIRDHNNPEEEWKDRTRWWKPGRKEEFNPFAKDASQQHRRRRERWERRHGRRPPPVEEPISIQKMDTEDLIKRERKVIESQQGVSKEIEELKLNHLKKFNKTKDKVAKRGLKSKLKESLKKPQERARDLSNELSEIQLEIQRRRADDILKERGGVPGMGAANQTTPSTQTNTPEPTSKSLTHDDRLAELRRKSEALKRQSANRSDDS